MNAPGGDFQTTTSVYAAIGQALPSRPPETIEELRVNTSMYDASQGANSGAHISLITKSGTNDLHGQAYWYHQTDAWNASPFFFNAIGLSRPALHRNVLGGVIGGPIKKDKLFSFASHQAQRVTDMENGTSLVPVPPGLTNDRSGAGLISAANLFIDPSGMCGQLLHPPASRARLTRCQGSFSTPKHRTAASSSPARRLTPLSWRLYRT